MCIRDRYEIGLAEISVRERSGLLAYSPLAGGFLSGKYRQNKMPEKSRQKLFGDYFTRYTKTHVPEIVEKYFKISSKYNLNFAQMSLKFCEIQKFITSVIIGATTMEQLKTNVESVNVKLNTEIINEINKKRNDIELKTGKKIQIVAISAKNPNKKKNTN